MRILNQGIQLPFGRREVSAHALPDTPGRAAVASAPGAAARNTNDDVVGVVGMNADRVNARHVVAAAEPLLTLRHPPQTFDERPGASAVIGAEQAPWQRAGPDAFRRARMIPFKNPDLLKGPRVRILGAFGLGRIGG